MHLYQNRSDPTSFFIESLNNVDLKGEKRYELIASLRVALTNNTVRYHHILLIFKQASDNSVLFVLNLI